MKINTTEKMAGIGQIVYLDLGGIVPSKLVITRYDEENKRFYLKYGNGKEIDLSFTDFESVGGFDQ